MISSPTAKWGQLYRADPEIWSPREDFRPTKLPHFVPVLCGDPACHPHPSLSLRTSVRHPHLPGASLLLFVGTPLTKSALRQVLLWDTDTTTKLEPTRGLEPPTRGLRKRLGILASFAKIFYVLHRQTLTASAAYCLLHGFMPSGEDFVSTLLAQNRAVTTKPITCTRHVFPHHATARPAVPSAHEDQKTTWQMSAGTAR